MTERGSVASRLQPRSITPGRQRWDITYLREQPGFADHLVEALRQSQGVATVRANTVTGRILIHHDDSMTSDDVGRLVRQSVSLIVQGPPTPAPRTEIAKADFPPTAGGDSGRPVLLLAGAAAGALLLGNMLLQSPLVRLGAVVVATGAVVLRAWRRSGQADLALGGNRKSRRHPLMQIVGPHRRQLYLSTALSAAGQALDLMPPLIIGWMAVVLLSGTSPTLVGLGLTTAPGQLWFLGALTALVSLAQAFVSFEASMMWRDLSQSVQEDWRRDTYAHVQRVELGFLEGERTTRLARVMTDDIDQLGRFFAGTADYLVSLGTGFLVVVPVFLIFAPGFAWIAFLPVPAIAWLSFHYQSHSASAFAAGAESAAQLNSQLVNNLEAMATVKSFDTKEFENARISELGAESRRSGARIDRDSSAYTSVVRLSTMISFTGTIVLGGLEVLSGDLPYAVFVPLVSLPQIVLWQVPRLGGAVEDYQRTVAALGRVLDVGSLPVEPDTTGRELVPADVGGEIAFQHVTFNYPDRSPVFEDLSIRLAAKRTTGIVGVTGAGKTTIAKLLLRFCDAGSGSVLLDGVDVQDVRLDDLRKAIGFVGQDVFLFDGTIDDNIRYGTFDASAGEVAEAARLAKADEFIEALPHRYDTMVGERGATLSGGQRQRISLARAILKRAPILILDEATSAVDNETEAAIQHALVESAGERTLVIIAHRLSTIRHADWIYVLAAGGVVAEEGTHDELLERNGSYAALWRLQIGEV